MRLDSLPSMTAAIALYRRFGFAEIPAYCFNPVPGTLYLARRLAPAK
jgi:ribosomal protein S18 acetylase RimI-like enzyme